MRKPEPAAQNAEAAPAAPPPEPSEGRGRAIGYTLVPELERGAADGGRSVQRDLRLMAAECRKRGIPAGKLVRDLESHSGPDLSRPGLAYALTALADGEFGCLVVTRLDRLSRSAANLGTLVRMLEERGARLVVIDIGLDTATEEGRNAAAALVSVGELEQRKLAERTRKGLEAARHGRRSGRPSVADRPSLKQRIVEMRQSGMTLQAIADTLNDEKVPTVRGGAKWRPSSVQAAAGYKRPSRSGPRS